MDEVRFDGLLEREKQVLRLLWEGHDAKGVARTLDLSTNVVNERLRDVRRKLGVPSSREAARLLAWHEGTAPKSVGNNPFGIETDVSSAPPLALPDEQAKETAEAPAQPGEGRTGHLRGQQFSQAGETDVSAAQDGRDGQ